MQEVYCIIPVSKNLLGIDLKTSLFCLWINRPLMIDFRPFETHKELA